VTTERPWPRGDFCAATTRISTDSAIVGSSDPVVAGSTGTGSPRRCSRNGSGIIGLKDRVDVLGGKMTVDSPVGSGTVINVTIPLAMPPRDFDEGR
jgi:glucose-6-phosphate-specific signal transduction histidine kinase